jgi:bacteriorhodopsin
MQFDITNVTSLTLTVILFDLYFIVWTLNPANCLLPKNKTYVNVM